MHGGQQAADEIHQAGADQVAHAFHVVHDARDQRAALVGVVVGDRQPADVLLHFPAQFRDQPLASLESSWVSEKDVMPWIMVAAKTAADQRDQQCVWCLPITLSTRYLVEPGSTRLHSRLMTISTKPSSEHAAARPHQFLQQRQRTAQMLAGFPFGLAGRQVPLSTEYTLIG